MLKSKSHQKDIIDTGRQEEPGERAHMRVSERVRETDSEREKASTLRPKGMCPEHGWRENHCGSWTLNEVIYTCLTIFESSIQYIFISLFLQVCLY